MRTRRCLAAAIVAAVAVMMALAAQAQPQERGAAQQAGQQANQQTNQDAMEAYAKLMAVNENHGMLSFFEGDWKVTMTAWTQPGAEPSLSEGTASAEMILGGRFVMIKFQGDMLGQPFEGYQIVGFDNLKQKFVTLWIDSGGTGFYLTEGTRDEAGRTITDLGEWPDPMTGGTMKVRGVTKVVNPDEYTYEMYMVGPDGSEFRSLRNRAVRVKPEAEK